MASADDASMDPESDPGLPQSWEILYRTDGGALVEITVEVANAKDWDRRDEDERAGCWVERPIGPLIVAVRIRG